MEFGANKRALEVNLSISSPYFVTIFEPCVLILENFRVQFFRVNFSVAKRDQKANTVNSPEQANKLFKKSSLKTIPAKAIHQKTDIFKFWVVT